MCYDTLRWISACRLCIRWGLPHTHRWNGQCAEADYTVQVHVTLKAGSIEVCMGPRTPLRGPLYASIKVEESTWYVQDRLLTVQLLKRNRRGHYANGTSNADTFWMSVRLSTFSLAAARSVLQCHAYTLHCYQMCGPSPVPSQYSAGLEGGLRLLYRLHIA